MEPKLTIERMFTCLTVKISNVPDQTLLSEIGFNRQSAIEQGIVRGRGLRRWKLKCGMGEIRPRKSQFIGK